MSTQFRITERFRFDLRTDWLNATNHPDFTNATIDSNIEDPTFGRYTGAGSANNNRIVVIARRLNW